MAKYVLATPHIRGNSDVIINYEPAATAPVVGTAAILNSDGALAPFAGSGVLKGVAAYAEADKRQSVVVSGMGVPVKVASGLTIAVGDKVYVTSAGLFTNVATDNTATRATFVNDGSDVVVDGKTGAVVENCALIDFVGGL